MVVKKINKDKLMIPERIVTEKVYPSILADLSMYIEISIY